VIGSFCIFVSCVLLGYVHSQGRYDVRHINGTQYYTYKGYTYVLYVPPPPKSPFGFFNIGEGLWCGIWVSDVTNIVYLLTLRV